MMSAVFEGDEWKHQSEGADSMPHTRAPALTRAQAQARLDTDYAHGRISLMHWRIETEKLSEPPRGIIPR